MLRWLFYYDYDPGSDPMGISLDHGQDPLLSEVGGVMVHGPSAEATRGKRRDVGAPQALMEPQFNHSLALGFGKGIWVFLS